MQPWNLFPTKSQPCSSVLSILHQKRKMSQEFATYKAKIKAVQFSVLLLMVLVTLIGGITLGLGIKCRPVLRIVRPEALHHVSSFLSSWSPSAWQDRIVFPSGEMDPRHDDILLTGSTGNFGPELLFHLLEDDLAVVFGNRPDILDGLLGTRVNRNLPPPPPRGWRLCHRRRD